MLELIFIKGFNPLISQKCIYYLIFGRPVTLTVSLHQTVDIFNNLHKVVLKFAVLNQDIVVLYTLLLTATFQGSPFLEIY